MAIPRSPPSGWRTSSCARESVRNIRELAREQELRRAEQSTLGQMALALKRVIFAPPEIRMKRARIQALARAAMKERE